MKEILGVPVIFFIGITAFIHIISAVNCTAYEKNTGKETKIAFIAQCYIKDGSNWYLWKEYQYRLVAKGEMK